MLKLLQEFISASLNEETPFSSWMRRPKNNQIGDVSDEIEQQRREVFNSTKDDQRARVERLRHVLSTSMSVEQMRDAIEDFGEKPSDIAADSTLLARAAKDGDIDEVRRQLMTGLEKWETEMLKWSEADDYDTSSLEGHPMRSVGMGGNMGKRSNSP